MKIFATCAALTCQLHHLNNVLNGAEELYKFDGQKFTYNTSSPDGLDNAAEMWNSAVIN